MLCWMSYTPDPLPLHARLKYSKKKKGRQKKKPLPLWEAEKLYTAAPVARIEVVPLYVMFEKVPL